jgi:hypothetical protein
MRLTPLTLLTDPGIHRSGHHEVGDELNGRSAVRSGLRQLLLDGTAALVTPAPGT